MEDGFELSRWVITQRQTHAKNQLTADRVHRLNSLDFSWDPLTEQWNEAYEALVKFREREGHCRVPDGHVEDGLNLGRWVKKQRSFQMQMSSDRTKRLKSLGFIWKAR
jgi:hypothetical protein